VSLPAELLEIMQCLSCGGPMDERHDPHRLVCVQCDVAYPVADGIPVMLEEAAQPESGASDA